jgi:hypothetical protein
MTPIYPDVNSYKRGQSYVSVVAGPFHVVRQANQAMDRSSPPPTKAPIGLLRGTQLSGLTLHAASPGRTPRPPPTPTPVRLGRTWQRVFRAWEFKEEFRDVLRHVPVMINLAGQIWHTFDGIIAAVHSTCSTVASKATTPKSARSLPAAMTTTPSPPIFTSGSAGSPSDCPHDPEESQ